MVNASVDGNDIIYHGYQDISIAVSTDKGLVTPVLRNVQDMGFAEIEQGIADYAKKARDGKLSLDDLQGGTFTITNGGTFGSLLSTPIVNPPQSAILGMHTIKERADRRERPGHRRADDVHRAVATTTASSTARTRCCSWSTSRTSWRTRSGCCWACNRSALLAAGETSAASRARPDDGCTLPGCSSRHCAHLRFIRE